MADEVGSRDQNRVVVMMALTEAGEIVMLRSDSVTKRLLVETGSDNISAIADGRKIVTAAGTAEALVGVTTVCKEVTITALYTNTDMVVIGGSSVVALEATRRGIPLTPGQSITLRIDDVSKIYIDSVVSSEGVSFLYLN